jgi:hypothetical protein
VLHLLILGEIFVTAKNRLMDAAPLMKAPTTATVILMVMGITAMGVGLGSA